MIQSELSGSSQRWPLLWILSAPALLVDPANAGPLLDSTRSGPFIRSKPLVNPVAAGPLSDAYITVKV